MFHQMKRSGFLERWWFSVAAAFPNLLDKPWIPPGWCEQVSAENNRGNKKSGTLANQDQSSESQRDPFEQCMISDKKEEYTIFSTLVHLSVVTVF